MKGVIGRVSKIDPFEHFKNLNSIRGLFNYQYTCNRRHLH